MHAARIPRGAAGLKAKEGHHVNRLALGVEITAPGLRQMNERSFTLLR